MLFARAQYTSIGERREILSREWKLLGFHRWVAPLNGTTELDVRMQRALPRRVDERVTEVALTPVHHHHQNKQGLDR
jgi:hypothetical protein